MVDVTVTPVNPRTFYVQDIPFSVVSNSAEVHRDLRAHPTIQYARVLPVPQLTASSKMTIEITLVPRASKREAQAFIKQYFAGK